MKNKKRHTIAVFIGDTYTEHENEMINGFYDCAKKEDVNLVFLVRSGLPCDTNAVLSDMTGEDFQVHFSSIYDYVPLFKPDALILIYGSLSIFSDTPDKEVLYSYYQGIPCLLLKSVSNNPEVPYLVADNYVGMCDCIQHLITDHGYKKIAYLSGPVKNFDASERLRAYYDTMKKNGLDVTESMVAYGDYSESVEPQVEYLLDKNPGVEAIAFANDDMAKAGYHVCAERGLVIGKDLAITGFDDVSFAKTMNPPLTSVMHSSFLYSYMAMKNAIQLAKSVPVSYYTVPTVLCKRGSCGCSMYNRDSLTKYADREPMYTGMNENLEQLLEDFFVAFPYQEEKQQYKEQLQEFISIVVEHVLEGKTDDYNFGMQLPSLQKLLEHPRFTSVVTLDLLEKILGVMASYAPNETAQEDIRHILISTRQYVLSCEITEQQFVDQKHMHQNWFSNSFTQDLMSSDLSLQESLLHIMNRLKLMQIETCYFFLRMEPAEYETTYRLQIPEDLCLAAYYDDSGTFSLQQQDWIHVSGNKGVLGILSTDRWNCLTTYVLFSGQTQYGFMLCENKPQDINFMSICSLQIGSFLRYYFMNLNRRKIMEELGASMHLIQEQNSILNFISEYDELTKLLNRRGFMEKSIQMLNKNKGKTAYLLYGDLDHLKEINDCFGHSAGDFSLQTIADYLRKSLPEDAIIARIGGDEFAAFFLSEKENYEQVAKQTIKEYCNTFNQSSDIPYYIEMSLGICKCRCSSKVSITELLEKSDALLYEEKAKRRKSAKKEAAV